MLTANPSYRFVWSGATVCDAWLSACLLTSRCTETIWLSMWWPLQTPETQAAFRALIDRGAIEIVGGGWVQSDEVTLTFEEMIDQTTTGHEWVRENLNVTVKHGYQIDMFAGYSGLTPSIWALSGYEAMLLRYEGNDTMRAEWAADRAFEYVWHASASLGFNESSIFAHVVNGNYGQLCGASFCFEDSPAGNPPVTPANISARAATLAAFVNSRAVWYRGSDLLLLWGNDFAFWNAEVMFGNMSLLVDYINANEDAFGFNIRFSTFADYLDAKYATGVSYPLVEVRA